MVITCHPSLHVLLLLQMMTAHLFLLLLTGLSPDIAVVLATSADIDPPPQRMMNLRRRRRRMALVVGDREAAGSMMEEKMRLGSAPPSCHNKCNQCHPCWAVQVPTLPNHDLEQLMSRQEEDKSKSSSNNNKKMRRKEEEKFRFEMYDLETEDENRSRSNMYTNYKPLGWKCHCRGHFYNA